MAATKLNPRVRKIETADFADESVLSSVWSITAKRLVQEMASVPEIVGTRTTVSLWSADEK